jgi:F420-non-reducing hydrogenase small subunit
MDRPQEGRPARTKARIGMYWASGCGGCDISLLEIGPRLLELIEVADVVFWPCVADVKYSSISLQAASSAALPR